MPRFFRFVALILLVGGIDLGAAATAFAGSVDQYGDPLPEGAIARLGAKRFRHDGLSLSLTYSGDGKYLVGCNFSGVVVWEAATGKEAYRLPYHPASRIATSRDGTTLAVSEPYFIHKENRITLWDLRTGKQGRTYIMPESIAKQIKGASIGPLFFLPDGKRLLLLFKGPLIVDLSSGRFTRLDDLGMQNTVVSADGKLVAAYVADEIKGVQLWNVATGKRLRAIANLADNDDRMFGRALALSPDCKTLAVGADKRVYLFDSSTGNLLAKMDAGSGGGPLELAFTPDGSKLLCNHQVEWRLRIWDVAKRKLLRTIDDYGNPTFYKRPSEMALAPDGKTVAFGTDWNVVRIWNVATGNELFTEFHGHFSQVNGVAFAHDGKLLASAGGNGPVQLWDTRRWRKSATLAMKSMAVAFSPMGNWLASGSNVGGGNARLQIWDLAKKRSVTTLRVRGAEHVVALAFSRDQKKLCTLEWNQGTQQSLGVRRWTTGSWKQEKTWKIDGYYAAGCFNQEGNTLVCANPRQSIDIIDIGTDRPRRVVTAQSKAVYPVKPSPDTRTIASRIIGTPEQFCLWDVASDSKVFSFRGHPGRVYAIAWSPNASVIASGDLNDAPGKPKGEVKLWNGYNGSPLASFDVKSGVFTLAFSPDGKYLVAGLRDSTILVFDVFKATSPRKTTLTFSPADLETHWTNLLSPDASKAYRSIGTLIDVPGQSVRFLGRHLHPVSRIDEGKITQAIINLNSEKFATRQAASKELMKIGGQAVPHIQEAMKRNPPLETRRRLDEIVNKLDDTPRPETIRSLRAIMVLERIGTPEARAVLTTIAGGAPGARETEDAKESLERLANRR